VLRWHPMTAIGRRQFFGTLGAGFAAVLIAGCSRSDGGTASTVSSAGGALAGVSLAVRRDPG